MAKLWILISFLFLSFNALANGSPANVSNKAKENKNELCEKVDNIFSVKKSLSSEEILLLNNTINNFNKNGTVPKEKYCELNIVGKMLYKGTHFKKDKKRAIRLFYYLSEKDYPKSQFNFAFAMTKNKDADVKEVSTFLLGVYAKYLGDEENKNTAKKSRILLGKYISKNADYGLKKEVEKSMSNISMNYFIDSETEGNKVRNRRDTIFMILSLGVAAYNLSNIPNYSNAYSDYGTNPFINWGSGFGNALNLPQIGL